MQSILLLFARWDLALEEVGLEPTGGARTAIRIAQYGPRYSEEQALSALEEAHRVFGDPPRVGQYLRWYATERDERELPSAATIRKRFGSWAEALEALRARLAEDQSTK